MPSFIVMKRIISSPFFFHAQYRGGRPWLRYPALAEGLADTDQRAFSEVAALRHAPAARRLKRSGCGAHFPVAHQTFV